MSSLAFCLFPFSPWLGNPIFSISSGIVDLMQFIVEDSEANLLDGFVSSLFPPAWMACKKLNMHSNGEGAVSIRIA